jgi:TRAP-type C4-dicarboxylate transport system permease small subunit
MKPEIKATMGIVTSIIGIAVCLLLTWYGVKVTLDVFQRNLLLSTVLTPPAYLLFIIIPIGSLLLTLQFVRRALHFIRDRGASTVNEKSEDESMNQAMR